MSQILCNGSFRLRSTEYLQEYGIIETISKQESIDYLSSKQLVKWLNQLNYDPVPSLLESGNDAITLFAQQDLLDNTISVEDL